MINLTQHTPTPAQVEQGVHNLPTGDWEEVKKALTFSELPSQGEMEKRADYISYLAHCSGAKYAMIGGAPFFMSHLEKALQDVDIVPCYAFSIRESVEETLPNGDVVKRNRFRHAGFIEMV